VVTEIDLELPDGRTLHVYDTAGEDGRLAVLWHHGTPNLGPPPAPLFPAADRRPWGFAPAEVHVPVLLVHGGQDRVAPSSHGRWLASRIPSAELWLRPEDGHVSVLGSAGAALGWLRERASEG
jgi:pimeloyl-ACP methyl ester carboxylesterase